MGYHDAYEFKETVAKVFQGLRPLRKAKETASAISSSEANEGASDGAPSLDPASDAVVPDTPFVRKDVLSYYRHARENGLPEISRKTFYLLNQVVAMMRAYLLRRHLKADADDAFVGIQAAAATELAAQAQRAV